jgi:hypothetical protein
MKDDEEWEALPGGKRSYSRTEAMIIPDNSPHVRLAAFYLPSFADTATVSVQIIRSEGAAPMTVYALKINDNVNNRTQIAVSAVSIDGKPAGGLYWCNIVAIATPSPMA